MNQAEPAPTKRAFIQISVALSMHSNASTSSREETPYHPLSTPLWAVFKFAIMTANADPYTLFFLELWLFNIVELRRLRDYKNPGSMGKQFFLGLEKGLGGSGDPPYPGMGHGLP